MIQNMEAVSRTSADKNRIEVRLAGDSLVDVRHISRVVLAMMNFHRLRVDIGFERIFGIWKWR